VCQWDTLWRQTQLQISCRALPLVDGQIYCICLWLILCYLDGNIYSYEIMFVCHSESLKDLDISSNVLTSLPSSAWWTCKDLELLNLAGNHLGSEFPIISGTVRSESAITVVTLMIFFWWSYLKPSLCLSHFVTRLLQLLLLLLLLNGWQRTTSHSGSCEES